MNLTKPIKMLGGSVATALVIALAAAPLAASAAVPDVPANSTHPIWLSSGTSTPVLLAPTATPKLNASVYAAKSSNPADRAWAMPSGAVSEFEFISARGSEFDVDTWTIYSDPHTDPGANVNLKVSNFGTVNPGKSFDTVGNVGGDFSLGLAFVNATGDVIEANFAYITITPNANPVDATYTFSTPVAVQPLAITTQPADAAVSVGQTATFTAAASGTPTPTVKWQSSTNGTDWSDVSGATSTTLTVSNVTLAQTGTKYRAVFTNTQGTVNTDGNATLTVGAIVPTEPTGSDAGKVDIEAPAADATTVTIPAGIANANKSLRAWAWSDPTNLGLVTTDAVGNAIVDISGLPDGDHTIALAESDLTVVAWGTITVLPGSYDPIEKQVDLKAAVRASDLWSLEAENTEVDFGEVQRGASATRTLGKVTVVDDRNVLKGWTLGAAWTEFTAGTDEIDASALSIAPKPYAGYTPIAGVTVGTGANIAQSDAVSTLAAGALFDADLTFTAPVTAQVGDYHSTLTLTLTSK